jgi:hypothetical protein
MSSEHFDSLEVLSLGTNEAENDKRPMKECPDLNPLPICR